MSTAIARTVISDKFPIGVATTYSAGRSIDTSLAEPDTGPVFDSLLKFSLTRLRFIAVAAAAIITIGCGSESNVRPAPAAPSPEVVAQRQLGSGNLLTAATSFLKLSETVAGAGGAEHAAVASLAFRQAGETDTADSIVSDLESQGFDADSNGIVATAVLCAEVAAGNFDSAAKLAMRIRADELPAYAAFRYHYCTGAALLRNRDYSEATAALLESYRYAGASRADALLARTTWDAVSQLSEKAIRAKMEGADTSARGWYDLALTARRALADESAFNASFQTWQSQYTSHPAAQLEMQLREQAQALAVKPAQVALLLPFSAELKNAATAVRDGFLAARYLDSSADERPKVRIYDSSEEDFEQTVQQALKDGADMLVGPLRKNLVDRLSQLDGVQTKVLALNIVVADEDAMRPGFYQFGLSPEDEAAQVARRAYRGGNRALMLVPDTAWGQRMYKAFQRSWTELGGELVAEVFYGEDTEAYAKAVKRGLNVDLSEARSADIKRTIATALHAEPRRRQDIDVILLAAFPDNARQLVPQLRYFRAEDIAVFATSHVYAGGTQLNRDSDLDGVTFGDMPWLFGANDHSSFNAIRRNWGNESQTFARLYGFGIDAYRLLPYLPKLQQQRGLRIPGVTGDLWMDHDGVIHRNMTWLKFVEGIPTLLDHSDPIRVE